MSDDKPRPGRDADDDKLERAESAWLLAREAAPDTPAPSPELAREYAELEDLLANPPPAPDDAGWQDDVLRLATAAAPAAVPPSAPAPRPPQRRPIYRWAIAGTLIAAAAVVLLVLLRPQPRPDTSELEVAIRHGASVRGDSTEATPGDRLIIRARPRGAGELRVYRADGPLVARCPGAANCSTSADGEHSMEVTLDAPGQYHVLLVIGMSGDSPGGTMNDYLQATRTANARVVLHPPIDVR
jgi:hypothetical protein